VFKRLVVVLSVLFSALFLCACASLVRPVVSGQVEISKTPPAWVLEIYGSDAFMKVGRVRGVRDPKTGKIWVADAEFIPHEMGHELWASLTETEQMQWRQWFKEERLFISAYSQTDEKEFFAEHYRFYCTDKVFVRRPNWPDGGFTTTYAKAFPMQSQWFQNITTNLLAQYKK